MKIADEEIKIIQSYIDKNNLKIDSVKGRKTNDYYPNKMYRTHMDYDYLAANNIDAFKLINYLINIRNFKLVIGGSVPFSFKVVMDEMKRETLTGHIHLEKILQNEYQVIVDINMGGFPLGRTGIIKCNNCGNIEIEDLICITLAHLFKHENVFIKDINDLYYLLSSGNVRKEILLKKLKKYNLEDMFFIVYKFLKNNMGLKQVYNVHGSYVMLKISQKTWPYSKKGQFIIKAMDMLKLSCKQLGVIEGVIEAKRQICGSQGRIKTSYYRNLCSTLNQRVYLYPVVLFKKYRELLYEEVKEFKVVDDIYIYNRIIVLPIGLFIIHDNQDTMIERAEIEKQICFVINALNITDDDCNYTYIMEARKDTWLY